MKSAPIYLFPLWLLLLCISACQDKAGSVHELNRAEALMQEYPDSSLHVLKTLSLSDFRQESNQARFALLYSQALDKNYIDVADDSLISVAVDYYKDKGEVRNKFLSYYYMGRVHANGERYLQATSYLMESEQLADEVGDDYLLGLLYSEMGRIYRLYYDFPKSLEAHQKAAEYYERAGKIRHRNYMWRYQSGVSRNVHAYGESEQLLLQALESAKEESDTALIKSCMGDLVMLYVTLNRTSEARKLYTELEFLGGLELKSSSFFGQIANMYASEGEFEQAMDCIAQGWRQAVDRIDSANMYISVAEVYSMWGKGEMAYQNLLKGVDCQNDDVRYALQQPVLTAQRDYLSEKLEFEAYKQRTQRQLFIHYVLFSIIILVAVSVNFYRKHQREKEKARRTIDELHDELHRKEEESRRKVTVLLKELEERNQADGVVADLRAELSLRDENLRRYIQKAEKRQGELQARMHRKAESAADLFRTQMETMGELIVAFEERKCSNTKISSEIRQWESLYFVGGKASVKLEKMVNEYCDDAMFHFRREVLLNEETDYRRVCYLFAGVSIKAIALLMKENAGSIYQRRSRLRSDIETSGYLHKELFLRLLSK